MNESTTVRKFDDVPEPSSVHLTTDTSAFGVAEPRDVPLNTYLDRWTAVGSITWTHTQAFGEVIYSESAWQTLFSTDHVERIIRNYSKVRGAIEVRFQMSASPTYYGHVIVQALPRPMTFRGGQIGSYNQLGQYDDVYTSTQNVYTDITPAVSDSKTLRLPWVGQHPAFSVAPNPTPVGHYDMWDLRLHVVEPLRNGSDFGGTAAMTITVLMRLVDYNLDVPFIGQGGGMVSSGLSTIANVSGAAADLVGAPILRAASKAARGASDLASALGFTRTYHEEKTAITPQVFSAMSTSDAADTAVSLTLFTGSTVSTDPAASANETADLLAFDSFLTRPTLVKTATWDTTQIPGTLIMAIPVTPNMLVPLGGSDFATTPGYMAAGFNTRWRGGMRYQVKVFGSALMRGRLNISYHPTNDGTISPMPLNYTSRIYNTYVDIFENNIIDFCVGWASPHYSLALGSFTSSAATDHVEGFTNGKIVISVANDLVAPDPLVALTVELYQAADTGMQYLGPKPFADGAFIYQAGEEVTGQSVATVRDCVDLVPRDPTDSSVAAITYGESTSTLRPLTGRSSYFDRIFMGPGASDSTSAVPRYALTVYRTLSFQPTSATNSFEWSDGYATAFYARIPHPISFLSTCFVGWRGSVNFKLDVGDPNSRAGGADIDEHIVSRQVYLTASPEGAAKPSRFLTELNTGFAYFNLRNSGSSQLCDPYVNSALEVRVPHSTHMSYNPCSWIPINAEDNLQESSLYEFPALAISTVFENTSVGAGTTSVASDTQVYSLNAGAGPDFDFVHFRRTPRVTAVPYVGQTVPSP